MSYLEPQQDNCLRGNMGAKAYKTSIETHEGTASMNIAIKMPDICHKTVFHFMQKLFGKGQL